MPRFRELKQIEFSQLHRNDIFYAQKTKPAKCMGHLFRCWKINDEKMGHRPKGGQEYYWYYVEPDEIVFVPKGWNT